MVTVAIPYKGKSLEQVLDKLVVIGLVEKAERDFYVSAVNADKKRIIAERQEIEMGERRLYSSNRTVEQALHGEQRRNSLAYNLKVDYDLLRPGQPSRILFKGLETKFGDFDVKVVGKSIYDISPALRNHEVQIGFVGWDELYSDHIEHLERKGIREWSAMNGALRKGSTDVRIIGSADLRDLVGHYILLAPRIGEQIKHVEYDSESVAPLLFGWEWLLDIGCGDFGPVHVDHKYQNVYRSLLPQWKAGFVGSNNVEEDVIKNRGVGIYVVQTGKTVQNRGIHIVGPLFYSETLVAVNGEDYDNDPRVRIAANCFKPSMQDSLESRAKYTWWQVGLLDILGDDYHYCDPLCLGYVPGRLSIAGVR